jgi:exportin-T
MFDVLDQLIGPLNTHIAAILSQPISGTDDQHAHNETKKAYVALLNNIMASKLQGIFISERKSAGIRFMIFFLML